MRVVPGCLLFAALTLAGFAESGPLGMITDRVVCAADPTQAYALYVPSQYAPGRRWPVIFCFDPGARGRMPVERLQAAAEKYGYIVAGSLNSRNGAWADNAAAISAMVRDVETHYAVDAKQVYTAGLSGGARVATAVALTGMAQGVLACSAGFPDSQNVPGKVPFAFFGTAGTEDFNNAELHRLDGELADRHAIHRIVIFPGGHEWAPVPLLTAGVEWLELQAMRAGARPKDEAFIAALFAARQAELPAALVLDRWRALQSLVADFGGLADIGALAQEAKDLGGSRPVKDALKAERAIADEEARWTNRLIDVATYGKTAKQNLATELRGLADAAEDSPTRAMARRVIANYGAMSRETVRNFFTTRDYTEAVATLELAAALRPDQTRTLFDLARAQAGSGDRKAALATLAQAGQAGFSDAARVEAEPLLAKVRTDPKYAGILQQIRANPPEPAGRGGPRGN